jgi:hypothetical protein
VDRPFRDPREVVDGDRLAVHPDAEIGPRQVRHRTPARVRNHDVEVHDAHLDGFAEGRELPFLSRGGAGGKAA